MKKIIALLLVFIAVFSICACSAQEDDGANDENTENGNTDDTSNTENNGNGNTGDPYVVISDATVRYNCKDGNGYDKSVKESNNDWIARFDGVELGNLELYGCERTDEGYKIVNSAEFAIRYKVTQNLGALVSDNGTKNGAESMWVNSDTCSLVLDTDIKTTVGVGAYYVKIIYSDGGEKTLSGTNFFQNAKKDDAIDMLTAADVASGKIISSIEVTLVYETYAGAPGFLGVWWHEYANWRCEYTYNF